MTEFHSPSQVVLHGERCWPGAVQRQQSTAGPWAQPPLTASRAHQAVVGLGAAVERHILLVAAGSLHKNGKPLLLLCGLRRFGRWRRKQLGSRHGYREALHVSSTLRSRQHCSWPSAKKQLVPTCTAASMRCASASSSEGDSCNAACSNRIDGQANPAGECGAAADGLSARPGKQNSFQCTCALAPQQANTTVAGRRGAQQSPLTSCSHHECGAQHVQLTADGAQSTGCYCSSMPEMQSFRPGMLSQLCCAHLVRGARHIQLPRRVCGICRCVVLKVPRGTQAACGTKAKAGGRA